MREIVSAHRRRFMGYLLLAGLPLPGAAQTEIEFPLHPPQLRARLVAAFEAKGPDYVPRTEHLLEDGRPRFINRLILEDSPYLLQHAHNPVDWYPWGEEAFDRARREGKAVFLSIGYSTCHWCHVMERESFDNEEIAGLMSDKFVCIKVDREQRPDLDEIYMTALQVTGKRGGWPMSSFLTPDRDPFFGATYFPPEQFRALMDRVEQVWNEDREQLVEQAGRISDAVRQATAARGEAEDVGQPAITQAVNDVLGRQDTRLGGQQGAPKFPHEPEMLFLLDEAWRGENDVILEAVRRSLDHMARGGLYDQVGGGFHRYSTDAEWLVPHFEKMLYNQAHLARAYAEASALTGDLTYSRVARQTLDYVLREMRAPNGTFYSATDADSEGEEGLFFLWTIAQLREALDREVSERVIDLYGVTEEGNFEDSNILHLEESFPAFAERNDLDLTQMLRELDVALERLWQVRERREHPLRDDKILLAWNGMMVTALASAGSLLAEPSYIAAASRAADTLWEELRRSSRRFYRVSLNGSESIPAMQEDYAYFAEALVALYDATGERVWLERAIEVTEGMLEQFWDAEGGGFFMSGPEIDPHLIARPKSPSDGAIPSGNSVALNVLAQLYRRTGETAYRDRSSELLRAFSSNIERAPAAHTYLLKGANFLLNREVGPLVFGAQGHVRASLTLSESVGLRADVVLELVMEEGWHVNSFEPRQKELIPLVIDIESTGEWQFELRSTPVAEEVTLGFQDEALSVYQGTVRFEGTIVRPEGAQLGPLEVHLQACNDEVCLRPEVLALKVPLVR